MQIVGGGFCHRNSGNTGTAWGGDVDISLQWMLEFTRWKGVRSFLINLGSEGNFMQSVPFLRAYSNISSAPAA
jgi:hypothetical protein